MAEAVEEGFPKKRDQRDRAGIGEIHSSISPTPRIGLSNEQNTNEDTGG